MVEKWAVSARYRASVCRAMLYVFIWNAETAGTGNGIFYCTKTPVPKVEGEIMGVSPRKRGFWIELSGKSGKSEKSLL